MVGVGGGKDGLVGVDCSKMSPVHQQIFLIADEAVRLLCKYMNRSVDNDVPVESMNLCWQQRASGKKIVVESSMVEGSIWQAIKATTYIVAPRDDIVRLLVDDDRLGEFDEMVDRIQVRMLVAILVI